MFLSDRNTGASLRPVEWEDLPRLAEWRNTPELRLRTREFRPLTGADQADWFERITGPNRHDFMFVVETPNEIGAGRASVGVVGLCHWEARDRTAEVSFYIGDESARGKGVATAALGLLHDYGFLELGLVRIWAECYEFNEPGIKLLKSLGYIEEGRLRKHVYRNGARHDSIMLGIAAEEWRT